METVINKWASYHQSCDVQCQWTCSHPLQTTDVQHLQKEDAPYTHLTSLKGNPLTMQSLVFEFCQSHAQLWRQRASKHLVK